MVYKILLTFIWRTIWLTGLVNCWGRAASDKCSLKFSPPLILGCTLMLYPMLLVSYKSICSTTTNDDSIYWGSWYITCGNRLLVMWLLIRMSFWIHHHLGWSVKVECELTNCPGKFQSLPAPCSEISVLILKYKRLTFCELWCPHLIK